MLIGKKVPVGVHRQRDGAMPHDGFDHVRMNALQREPGTAGMAEGMEVQCFALVVRDRQEVAFFSLAAGLGIVPYFVQPGLAGRGQVRPEHIGNVPFIGHGENTGRGCFGGHEHAQLHGQVRLDILFGLLAVLGVLGLAANVGLLAGKE